MFSCLQQVQRMQLFHLIFTEPGKVILVHPCIPLATSTLLKSGQCSEVNWDRRERRTFEEKCGPSFIAQIDWVRRLSRVSPLNGRNDDKKCAELRERHSLSCFVTHCLRTQQLKVSVD